jgi:bifunctional enzyme Fae/Hps
MNLSKKYKYLQIALNSTLNEAYEILNALPASDRIIIEVGTPLIKSYGTTAIKQIYEYWRNKLFTKQLYPYVVADLKTMDRAETEVLIAKQGGASGAICLGQAPIETINSFIHNCKLNKIDSMIDMMNIPYPTKILRQLKTFPDVVILHRGVDEENFNKDKLIPYVQINKVISGYNVVISIGGGDTIREVQRAIFNGADIVLVWKEFYHSSADTAQLAKQFLDEIHS